MTDQFLAEIRIFTGNFAPVGWAFCDGQLLPISQNTALFALLGTAYGGDGKSTFALPDLQGLAPMHSGQGPGLSERFLGETGGVESVALLTSEMPFHSHVLIGDGNDGNSTNAQDNYIGTGNQLFKPPGNLGAMQIESLSPAGGERLPHNNMHPYLTLTFIIAVQGEFPERP